MYMPEKSAEKTIRLYPDRKMYLGIAAVCGVALVMLAGAVYLGVMAYNGLTALIAVILVCVAGWLLVNVAFRNRVYLQLDDEGLTASTLTGRLRLKWADIDGFYVPPASSENDRLRVKLHRAADSDGVAAGELSSVHDMDSFKVISLNYGMNSTLDLANLLDAHLQRYRQQHAAVADN